MLGLTVHLVSGTSLDLQLCPSLPKCKNLEYSILYPHTQNIGLLKQWLLPSSLQQSKQIPARYKCSSFTKYEAPQFKMKSLKFSPERSRHNSLAIKILHIKKHFLLVGLNQKMHCIHLGTAYRVQQKWQSKHSLADVLPMPTTSHFSSPTSIFYQQTQILVKLLTTNRLLILYNTQSQQAKCDNTTPLSSSLNYLL